MVGIVKIVLFHRPAFWLLGKGRFLNERHSHLRVYHLSQLIKLKELLSVLSFAFYTDTSIKFLIIVIEANSCLQVSR